MSDRSNTEEIWRDVDDHRASFEALSDRVWDMPETCYAEHRSAAEHEAELRRQGFRVTTGIAGIPTAMVGEAGEEGPVIAILGEYDALPGLSQEAGVAEHRPLEQGGNGHGCGHNLLGSASMLAATAVKQWMERNGVKGRVRYYGCPAEEGGGAKAFMVRAGAFDDVDVAISWHPESFTEVLQAHSLANTRIDFRFTGRASHAAAAPELGRSALDAVELTNIGVNYMREHMPSTARIHYAVIDAGGIAPNVVQAAAQVRYSVRAQTLPEMRKLVERVSNIARGAALMTETTLEIEVLSAVSNLLHNEAMAEAMSGAMQRLGPPQFDEADRAFAREIQGSLSPEEIAHTYRRFGLKQDASAGDEAMCSIIVPRDAPRIPMMGSTDLGDVSWVVPLVQLHGATCAVGTPFHSWQLTAQGKSPGAKKGMTHAAKVMAATAVAALGDPAVIEKARRELRELTAATPYESPIPPATQPPLRAMGGAR
ncbi:M20 family metallopeptidase [Roseomonas elaeocarpi]|uniref:M20 family metallopeptidase n=1 Tax=Roseomonas elaeocarpi TaxID=907779 RepID=A0ABV6JPN2_9PROT